MTDNVKRQSVAGSLIAALLVGLDTVPCTFCEAPCAVPDYVLAVVQRRGQSAPLGVCAACSAKLEEVLPIFAAGLRDALERASAENERGPE